MLAVLVVGWLASRASAEEIREIVIEDNKKTTSDTVELIAQIEVGDEWTPTLSDLIKQRLVTSGLFKDVEVFWDPVPGGVRVHILVKDKHSWVIAPAFYTQPTNVGGGIGFGENNLFGLNQKLLLYAQIATGDSFFIGAWVIPSIGGSRFYAQLDTYDKTSRNIEYAAPTRYLDLKNRQLAFEAVFQQDAARLANAAALRLVLAHGLARAALQAASAVVGESADGPRQAAELTRFAFALDPAAGISPEYLGFQLARLGGPRLRPLLRSAHRLFFHM